MQKGFGIIGILIVVGIITILSVGALKTGYLDRNPFVPTSEEKSAIEMAKQMKEVLEQTNTIGGETSEISDNADVSEVSPPNVDTTGWKTYHNEEYGFEVKYPGTWNGKTARLSDSNNSSVWFNYEERGDWSFRFVLRPYDGQLEEWKPYYPVLSSSERITVGNYVGKSFLVDTGEGGKNKVLVWANDRNDKLFMTEYGVENYHYESNPEMAGRFIDSVISTFKFIE